MEYIKNKEIKNKTVILRSDLNVTIKEGKIIDDTKIKKSLETLEYLLENNNKVIMMSHLGKVKNEEDKTKNTLYPVYIRIKELLKYNIYFSKSTRGTELEETIKNANFKEVILIENTRHEDYPEKLESVCDNELSKYWASLADVFVNDAFGTSHRKHASTYGIKNYIESYYGFLINEEKEKLDELIYTKEKPFTVIMGGAKVEDKLKLIKELLSICDYLIVGGGIANTFMYAKEYEIGKSLVSKDNIEEIKSLLKKFNDKIILPIDFYVENNKTKIYRNLNQIEKEDIIYDIGEVTINKYKEIINNSKIVFINGTVGLYEDERFRNGTINMLKILSESNAKTFVGGGDAVSSINKLGFSGKLYYESTGGGATLEYIIDKKLAALED